MRELNSPRDMFRRFVFLFWICCILAAIPALLGGLADGYYLFWSLGLCAISITLYYIGFKYLDFNKCLEELDRIGESENITRLREEKEEKEEKDRKHQELREKLKGSWR